MLETLVIFGKGGAILWTVGQLLNVKGNPIDSLIQKCLLEDRAGDNTYVYRPPTGTSYTLKWTLHNGLDLVFVAIYQSILAVPFVDSLLASVRDEFAKEYQKGRTDYKTFDDTYQKLLKRAEGHADRNKAQARGKQIERSTGGGQSTQRNGSRGAYATSQAGEAEEDEESGGAAPARASAPDLTMLTDAAPQEPVFDKSALLQKFGKKKGSKTSVPTGKPGKQKRSWKDQDEKVKPEELDFSEKSDLTGLTLSADPTAKAAASSRMDAEARVEYEDEDEASLRAASAAPGGSLLSSFLSSVQTRVMGKEALTAEDLAAALEAMRKRLEARNVSAEVARQICSSVASTLQGRRLASLTGVTKMVRSAMEAAITRILSPKRSIDVLAEIRTAQAKRRPYSIVFVGVNGVGKSTNLAKIAYWLRQQDLKVMIAACDTFRSGAVEQLKTHCHRLGVPLFDRGYDKDPTNVAAEALRTAARDGIDVVLVDTAGRMQDNEPLMHALSTLINRNDPDLVLFVGEALVGHDGVNQLVKFNERLSDLSPPGREPRLIDGILVTKFDAIDDKVGAVLSMTYSSGAPVMFVGCGQTYVDLMRLDVRAVVKALLK